MGIAGALRGGNVSVHRGSCEATLRLDGAVVGKAPLNLTVKPGAHRLEILDPSGHVAATQNLLIEVGVDYAVDLD